mmetsp:Transcript_31038/g.34612  ORF Transcript_31038/g.34612 Transcript_31038/m.34612 type:complete len:208 (+) Transcript_31038:26-649(+)
MSADFSTPIEPQAAGTTAEPTVDPIQDAAANAVMASAMSYAKSYITAVAPDTSFTNFRSISVFCSRERLSFPAVSQIFNRLRSNLIYYQTNYMAIIFLIALYSAFTSPLLLVGLALIVWTWMYLFKWRTEPIKVMGFTIPDTFKMVVIVGVTLLLCYFTSIGSTVFWLLCASAVIIFLHALFHQPEQELDEFGFGFDGLPTTMPATT